MEFISDISIRDILLPNNNWWRFFLTYCPLIRYAIINVINIIACDIKHLGSHTWLCRCCGFLKIVFHTCKSRFCPSCGKKATDQWGQKNIVFLPNAIMTHLAQQKKLFSVY